MPQTVEAVYHDGIVELKHKPIGIQKAKSPGSFSRPRGGDRSSHGGPETGKKEQELR